MLKKKRSKTLSSTSNEEDEMGSKEQYVTKTVKSAKRKHQDSSLDRCTEKQDTSLMVNDVSISSRQIKKVVYKLAKSPATDQRPSEKEEACKTTTTAKASVSRPRHGESSPNISGKATIVTVGKRVERGPSKPSPHSAGTAPQKTEKTSQGDSKLTKKMTSDGFVSDELKEQRHIFAKRSRMFEELHRTEKTKILKKKEKKKLRKKLKKEELKAIGNLYAGTKSSTAATEKPCTSAKHATSDHTLNVFKHLTPKLGGVTLVAHKTTKSPYTRQENEDSIPTISRNLTSATELAQSGSSARNVKQGTVHGVRRSAGTPASQFEGQDEQSNVSRQLPTSCSTITSPWYDKRHVVEELHLARSQKKLEVNVMQSYGELTCMEIDLPGATGTLGKQPLQKDLILVLDTNILLSHLDYVKKIRSLGLGALGFPVVLIPWVVLQELDSLKMRNRLSGSVAHLASPAIKWSDC